MKVGLITELLERLRAPAKRTLLLSRCYEKARNLFQDHSSPHLLTRLSLSLSILERLHSYLLTELTLNKNELDTYSRLGHAVQRMKVIGEILLKLYPYNYFLTHTPLTRPSPSFVLRSRVAVVVDPPPPAGGNPLDPHHANLLCMQLNQLFSRASSAYSRAHRDSLIDPSFTPQEVDAIETYIIHAEDLLSPFLSYPETQ